MYSSYIVSHTYCTLYSVHSFQKQYFIVRCNGVTETIFLFSDVTYTIVEEETFILF